MTSKYVKRKSLADKSLIEQVPSAVPTHCSIPPFSGVWPHPCTDPSNSVAPPGPFSGEVEVARVPLTFQPSLAPFIRPQGRRRRRSYVRKSQPDFARTINPGRFGGSRRSPSTGTRPPLCPPVGRRSGDPCTGPPKFVVRPDPRGRRPCLFQRIPQGNGEDDSQTNAVEYLGRRGHARDRPSLRQSGRSEVGDRDGKVCDPGGNPGTVLTPSPPRVRSRDLRVTRSAAAARREGELRGSGRGVRVRSRAGARLLTRRFLTALSTPRKLRGDVRRRGFRAHPLLKKLLTL